jgi:nucleoid DNA-binding protein
MRKAKWVGASILTAAAGFVLGQAPQPQPQPPQRPVRLGSAQTATLDLKGRIAKATKLPENDVAKMLAALGPAVRDLLGQGETVEIPNLGTFRVVRVPEHRDLVDGRPATIAGSNSVEFLPSGRFADAANQPGVKPAETVPPFEYNPLPDQTRGLKTGPTRAPNNRTP